MQTLMALKIFWTRKVLIFSLFMVFLIFMNNALFIWQDCNAPDIQTNLQNQHMRNNDVHDVLHVNCPVLPTTRVGKISVNRKPVTSMESLEKSLEATNISKGGHWRPTHCKAQCKVAIIVPYRDREEHLKIFLRHVHAFAQKQNLDYGIYIVEQGDAEDFNRGALLNIGYKLTKSKDGYNCFIFHDVDCLPADDRIQYSCPEYPRHLAAAIDNFNYRLAYQTYTGCVLAMSKEHFEEVNGFSNVYFGWGGEDDDMWLRMEKAKLPIQRFSETFAIYMTMPHQKALEAAERKYLCRGASERMGWDGLSSLKFILKNVTYSRLFTKITVHLNKTLLRGNITIPEKILRWNTFKKHPTFLQGLKDMQKRDIPENA